MTHIASVQHRLARAGTAQVAAALQTQQQQLTAIDDEVQRAAERVSLLSKLWPFGQSDYEKEVASLKAKRKQLQEEHDEQLAAWTSLVEHEAKESRPLEVVFALAQLIHEAKRNPAIGCEQGANRAYAAKLEAIAEGLLETWAPQVSIPQLAEQLGNDELRKTAANQPTLAWAGDAEQCWATITPEHLLHRVAVELESNPEFISLRSDAGKQHREWLQACQAHAQAAAAVSGLDRLNVFGDSPNEKARDARLSDRQREHGEAYWSFERYHHALICGFSVHPIIWLQIALLGAAACLRHGQQVREPFFDSEGEPEKRPMRHGRAVFFACMVEARRAAERAFPGLFAAAWPTREEAQLLRQGEGSPYRMAATAETDAAIAPVAGDPDARFFARLEKQALRLQIARAVCTATMLGVLGVHHRSHDERVSWLDRLAFWSDTWAEQRRDQIEERQEFLGRHLNQQMRRCAHAVKQQAQHHHALGLGQTLLALVHHVDTIGTQGGESSSPRSCSVINRGAALGATKAVTQHLEAHYGVRGSRSSVQGEVERILSVNGSIAPNTVERSPDGRLNYAGILFQLTETLRPTAFASLFRENEAQRVQMNAVAEAERTAKEAVPLLDTLNVFSDSPAEQRRDQAVEQAQALRQQLSNSASQLAQLTESAFTQYPPLLIQQHAGALHGAISQLSAHSQRRTRTHETRNSEGKVTSRRTEVYYVCVLDGMNLVYEHRNRLCHIAGHRFTAFPTPSEMLERWVLREL